MKEASWGRSEADLLEVYTGIYSSLCGLQLQLQKSSSNLHMEFLSLGSRVEEFQAQCRGFLEQQEQQEWEQEQEEQNEYHRHKLHIQQQQEQEHYKHHQQGQEQNQEQEQEQGIRERLQWRLEHVIVKWEMLQKAMEAGYSRRDSQAGISRCK